MRRRLLESLGVAALLMAFVMLLQVSAVSVAGQAPKATAAAETGPAPRTAWGHPNLEGIWLDAFNTPLERPHPVREQGVPHRRRAGRTG